MDCGNLAIDGEPNCCAGPKDRRWASLLVGQVEQEGREGEEGQGPARPQEADSWRTEGQMELSPVGLELVCIGYFKPLGWLALCAT